MTMGHFTEDALVKFNAMCGAGLDFGEAPVYDFTRCVMSDGEIYGTDGQCKVGKPIADKEEGGDKKVDSRMAKLKRAFIKKMGREMTPAELKKAQNMIASIGVPIPAGESAESMLQKMLPKGAKVIPVKTA
jgi:hypothetical protein